jgi:Tfp pilus assembly protein PilX
MIRKLHNHPLIQAKHRPGFALIATISVMVLLVMIALAMLTLSTVELRSSSNEKAMLTARANARLALMLAIGELQKSAGADQRVTALAGINPANTTQPHLLGVWKSFKQSNTNTAAINYSTQKDGDFIQWLSSTTSANRISPTYPTQIAANPVKLVNTGTVSDPLDPSNSSNYISASAIDVAAATRETGKYAWHVFDESQKANLTINQATPTTDAERIASLGTGGKPGFQIDAAYEDLENLNEVDRGKLISLDSTELVSFEPITNSAFHYLTAGSNSLLVDVANGGYQKDLSLLFENTTLPADYTDRYINPLSPPRMMLSTTSPKKQIPSNSTDAAFMGVVFILFERSVRHVCPSSAVGNIGVGRARHDTHALSYRISITCLFIDHIFLYFIMSLSRACIGQCAAV